VPVRVQLPPPFSPPGMKLAFLPFTCGIFKSPSRTFSTLWRFRAWDPPWAFLRFPRILRGVKKVFLLLSKRLLMEAVLPRPRKPRAGPFPSRFSRMRSGMLFSPPPFRSRKQRRAARRLGFMPPFDPRLLNLPALGDRRKFFARTSFPLLSREEGKDRVSYGSLSNFPSSSFCFSSCLRNESTREGNDGISSFTIPVF